MLEVIFPAHVVTMMQHGHRLLLESLDRVAILAVEITGFRRLCAAMTMPAVVELMNEVFALVDGLLRDAGMDTLDVTHNVFWAFMPLECDPTAVCVCNASCICMQEASHSVRAKAQLL